MALDSTVGYNKLLPRLWHSPMQEVYKRFFWATYKSLRIFFDAVEAKRADKAAAAASLCMVT